MAMVDAVQEHQARCVPHLVELRLLAGELAGTPLPPDVVSAVGVAVGAVVTEAEVSGYAVIRETAARGSASGQVLLSSRLDRLGRAAREAVTSAQAGDAATLRDRLHRFDAVTAALWTVQLSVCD